MCLLIASASCIPSCRDDIQNGITNIVLLLWTIWIRPLMCTVHQTLGLYDTCALSA